MQPSFLHLPWLLAGASLLTAHAAPQTPCPMNPGTLVGGSPFHEAWVDPCGGDDFTGSVNCPDKPFLTIEGAIDALHAVGLAESSPGLVHAMPGVYSWATNGEDFPIEWRDFVHLQGAGAKRTIIRGDDDPETGNAWVFYPDADCDCGDRAWREVLVDMSQNLFEYEESIDGVTFQGGDVQVYIEDELPAARRVSNCVFDMLDYSAVGLDPGVEGPDFGILMVHVYDFTLGGVYHDIPMNVLNNTFIQGWSPHKPGIPNIEAKPDAVGICDVNDPLCWDTSAEPDHNTSLRGPGNPNIQNNLFRYVGPAKHWPLLGIDDSDTTALAGTKVGPTNAFVPLAPGEEASNGTYCSTPLGGATPTPAVNPIPSAGGVDPAFVGEMTTFVGGPLMPLGVGRDWRLLFDSVLVDAGSAPTPAGPGGLLTAVNGSFYEEPADLPASSFDFDGEYYGNLRVQGAFPDIGVDEVGQFVVAGYGNDTRSFGTHVCSCVGTPGVALRLLLTPGAGTLDVRDNMITFPSILAWTTQPGTAVPPQFIPGLGFLWIPPVTPLMPAVSLSPATYTVPGDAAVHSFGWGIPTEPFALGSGFCVYRNEQALFYPTGGGPIVTNYQASVNGFDLP